MTSNNSPGVLHGEGSKISGINSISIPSSLEACMNPLDSF